MSKYLKHLGMALMAVVSVALMAHEASAESTLEKILNAKKIRVAIDVANPPFGILDKSGQPDGSDVAVARQIAKDLGAEVEFVQVPSTGRIPALLAGRADVTIASISVTTDRAKAVMYCNPNGALSITIFAPQSVKIKTPADLVGKRVGITRATLEEATVPKMAPEGTKIVWYDDLASTVQALLSGQVDAAAMTAFAEKTVSDANPAKQLENKLLVTTAFYGPIVRPGDFELRQWINTWIFINTRNGTLATIYKKYTGIDLPPLPTF
ncbi:MAG TPA: transporter substrate-binding domain-containing protein [Casimicrobiaceae bacterium]|nr:transporter substrate-binding domain-containing protein [Casimicrobiaceae bacterium]